MNLKKKELIISIIIMIVFLIVGLNISVLATNYEYSFNGSNTSNTSNLNNFAIEVVNTTDNNTLTNNQLNNNNTNNPGQLADTGLEDLPWVVIGICAVSAIFAYKKIKEYKED